MTTMVLLDFGTVNRIMGQSSPSLSNTGWRSQCRGCIAKRTGASMVNVEWSLGELSLPALSHTAPGQWSLPKCKKSQRIGFENLCSRTNLLLRRRDWRRWTSAHTKASESSRTLQVEHAMLWVKQIWTEGFGTVLSIFESYTSHLKEERIPCFYEGF